MVDKNGKNSANKKQPVAAKPSTWKRIWNRIGRFFREVRQEYKATTWPTRKVLLSTTGVVAVILLVMGVYFGVLDLAFSSLTKFITTLLNIG